MTAPTLPARPVPIEAEGDWYTHPTTGEKFLRVTSALKVMPKEGLVPWAAGLTAKAAFAELPRVVAASRTRACGRTYARCGHDYRERCEGCPCGDCRDCMVKLLRNLHWVEKTRRADEGTRAHKAIEQWVLSGGVWPRLDDDIKPYIASFRKFVTDYGLTPESWEMTEATIINRTHGWGGTLDGQLRIRWGVTELADDFCARLCAYLGKPPSDVLVTEDNKTREDPAAQLYQDHSAQLAAYRRGQFILFRDGTEVPLPPTDGGALLQLRPFGESTEDGDEEDGGCYTFRPLVTDDHTYQAFLGSLTAYRWVVERGSASIAVKSFPLPEEYKRDKRNRKAREKRAAAKSNGTQPAARTVKAPAAPTKTTTAKAQPPARTLAQRVLGNPTTAPDPFAAVGQGAIPHPDSPYGDEVPF